MKKYRKNLFIINEKISEESFYNSSNNISKNVIFSEYAINAEKSNSLLLNNLGTISSINNSSSNKNSDSSLNEKKRE